MDERESILSKLEDCFNDLNAHDYGCITDDSEIRVELTVKDMKWLYEYLGGDYVWVF